MPIDNPPTYVTSSTYSTSYVDPEIWNQSADIVFAPYGKVVFTIKSDGQIVKGPGYTTKYKASAQFLDTMAEMFPQWKKGACK